MTNSIKLDPKNIKGADLLKIVENLKPLHTSVWEGRIVTDQLSLKNYSYDNLLRVFQRVQGNIDEDLDQVELIRNKLLELNSSYDSNYLSLDNVKNIFHSLINWNESVNPNKVLQDCEFIEEEIDFENEEENQPVNASIAPKWIFLAGAAGGVALTVLLYSAHAYMNQVQQPCIPPEELNAENAKTYCNIAESITDKKVLSSVAVILKDMQKSQEGSTKLRNDLKIISESQASYNIPVIRAKILEWLKEPAYQDAALELIMEMAKRRSADPASINVVKQGIFQLAESENKVTQLKALKAFFALRDRHDYVPDANLLFEKVLQHPEKLHKENFETLKTLIQNSKMNTEDFQHFFNSFNHVAGFTQEHADFSNFLMSKIDLQSALKTVDSLISKSKNDRAYDILDRLSQLKLNQEQQDLTRASIQKTIDHSPLNVADIAKLVPIVENNKGSTLLTVQADSVKAIVENGSLENCDMLGKLFISMGNNNQLHDFAKMLLNKKTHSLIWQPYHTNLDLHKREKGLEFYNKLGI